MKIDCIQRAIAAGAYVGNNYLGAPTDEPKIKAFRGLHAKCYAMEELDEDDKKYNLNVVIAGIPKKASDGTAGRTGGLLRRRV